MKDDIARVTYDMSNRFGFSPRKEKEYLWILGSKKHPEYDSQQQMGELIKNEMTKIKASEITSASIDQMEKALQYFNSVIETQVGKDKPQKKLRYAGYYNRSKIYLMLDKPQLARLVAEKLIANGFDERWATSFERG